MRLLGGFNFHLTTEDKQIYPLLLRHPDTRVRAVAVRFQQELGGLAQAVEAYKVQWPPARWGVLHALGVKISATPLHS